MTSWLQHKGLQARGDRPQAPLTGLRAGRVEYRELAAQRRAQRGQMLPALTFLVFRPYIAN